MSRPRAIVALLTLALALPSVALGQGAGDEQYQDPFGDERPRTQPATPRAAQDDGLSDEPPVDDGQPAPPPDEPAPEPDPGPREDEAQLPNTGSDPRLLAFAGLLLVLVGVGLRLRTIDPDAY